MKTVTRLLGALIVPLALTGCLDVEEEVWVRPDGTVQYRCAVEEPELSPAGASLAAGVRRRAEAAPSVLRVDGATTRRGSRRRTVVDVELRPTLAAGEAPALEGFEVEPLGGGRVRVTRRLGAQVAAAAPGSKAKDPLAELLARRLLDDHGYTLRLHAPRITSANGALDASGTTVEWRVPWTDAGQAVLTAELELCGAGACVPWLAALLVVAGLVLVALRRRALAALAVVAACALLVWRHGVLEGGLLGLALVASTVVCGLKAV